MELSQFIQLIKCKAAAMNFKSWYLAVRPWTLPAAAAPVIIGGAMAFGDGKGNALAVASAMIVALLIQTGTNFVNDISDYRSGADKKNSFGPIRVIQTGLISEQTLLVALVFIFSLTVIIGAWIIMRQTTWALAPIGLLCIAAGIIYTAGPYPAAYLGLGELMVIVFFGPVAAAGTYYLQTKTLTWPVILAGFACGFICCGILIVNNYRDYEADKEVGKRTLAVRLGRRFAQWEYLAVLVLAAVIPVIISFLTGKMLLSFSSGFFILCLPAVRTIFSTTDGKILNGILAYTGKVLIIFSILFSIAWIF